MPSNPVQATISSVGTAATVALDWMAGGPTSMRLTAASTTMSGGGVMQYTLDDLMRTPSSLVTWSGITSSLAFGTGSTAGGTVIVASNVQDSPWVYTIDAPVAGIRFSASAVSSSSLVLEVLQGRGW